MKWKTTQKTRIRLKPDRVDAFGGFKTEERLNSGQPLIEFRYEGSRYEVYGDSGGEFVGLLGILGEDSLESLLGKSDAAVIRDPNAIESDVVMSLDTRNYSRNTADRSYRGLFMGYFDEVKGLLRKGEYLKDENEDSALVM